jgi:hypothetical protein
MSLLEKAKAVLVIPRILPKPDEYENYWLTQRPMGACILFSAKASREARRHGAADTDRWFASLGGDAGVLFHDGAIRYFVSPASALAALIEEEAVRCLKKPAR